MSSKLSSKERKRLAKMKAAQAAGGSAGAEDTVDENNLDGGDEGSIPQSGSSDSIASDAVNGSATSSTSETTSETNSSDGVDNGDDTVGEFMDGEDANLQSKLAAMTLLDKDAWKRPNAQGISPRVVTGQLVSETHSFNIHVDKFSLSLFGKELVSDTSLELNFGRRYGIIGANGAGKSTLLAALGFREIPMPSHIDIFYLDREEPASDVTAIDAVIGDTEAERLRIEAEAEQLLVEDPESEELQVLYDRLDELDADTARTRAATILHGLGFNERMMEAPCKDFSGGWRMRISLSKALFLKPMLLLLDNPTNHLDMEAVLWLEEYLKNYNRILLLVSHSQDFMNSVCTNIMLLKDKKLSYWKGNYDQYVKTRSEVEENQLKQYQWEQDQITHMKDYIARFGHGSAKLARQAQSKEKVLKKMVDKGLTDRPTAEKVLKFRFPECDKLPPPVLAFNSVSFGYPKSAKGLLYKDANFGIDLESRIAIVGPNGAGKSTLLKLITGELQPVDGTIRRHNHLKIARFHQHIYDELPQDLSPCEFMMKEFPETIKIDNVRSSIGRFGITGMTQTLPIRCLSDGQKSRLVFAWLAQQNPNMLCFDEPTNHLDIETIDSLADAINNWNGAMCLISHDFRLITQVAKEIWTVADGKVSIYQGDILKYKEYLRKSLGLGKVVSSSSSTR